MPHPPIDDPSLPSYQCAAYNRQAPLWAYLDDVFVGSESWLGRGLDGRIKPTSRSRLYLPQEPAEEDSSYESRLARSPFTDNFAQAIRDFVGLVASNGVGVDGVSFLNWDNLDSQGTSGNQLVQQIAIAALRRGHTFIWVDAPAPDASVRSQADLIRSGRKPHWVHIEAPDVLNWSFDEQHRLVRVTIRERRFEDVGFFGEQLRTYYRVLMPGHWHLYELVEAQGKWVIELRDSGTCSLSIVPLVPVYAGLKIGEFESKPPLKSLADLNVIHYQVKSDHLQKIHKCCLPIPVIRDSMSQTAEYALGPNTMLKIQDPNGGFKWEEPDAASIEQSRREVQDLEAAMDFLGAAYLSKPSDRQAAATTYLVAARVESSLELFAGDLSAGLNKAIEVSADYTSSERQKVKLSGTLVLSGKIVQSKPDPQLLLAYLRLFELKVIDAEKLLILLMSQGFLPGTMESVAPPGNNGKVLSQTKNDAL